jgi:hypothetical protein
VKKYKPVPTCLQVFYLTFIKDQQDGEGRGGVGRGGEGRRGEGGKRERGGGRGDALSELQTDSRMA